MNFKIGDKVSDHGRDGVVTGTEDDTYIGFFPLTVHFSKGGFDCYTFDGRAHEDHIEPSLKLLERIKSKKMVMMYQAIIRLKGSYSMLDKLVLNEMHGMQLHGDQFVALGPAVTFEVDDE